MDALYRAKAMARPSRFLRNDQPEQSFTAAMVFSLNSHGATEAERAAGIALTYLKTLHGHRTLTRL
jgi:hypothetical protein